MNILTWNDIQYAAEYVFIELINDEFCFDSLHKNKWQTIEDREYIEELILCRRLEWIKRAWLFLIQSGFASYSEYEELYEVIINFIALIYFYCERAGMVSYSYLEREKFCVQLINDTELYKYVDSEEIQLKHSQLDCFVQNAKLKVVQILIQNFGSKLKLYNSIENSLQLNIKENCSYYEDDEFNRNETEMATLEKSWEYLNQNWEEVELSKLTRTAKRLANYFSGEVVTIDFTQNKKRSMKKVKDDSILPKYLFSEKTFELLLNLEQIYNKTKKIDSGMTIIDSSIIHNDAIIEYVEQPFNQLCRLLSAKLNLPAQLEALPGYATWDGLELEKEFSQFKILYFRINKNGLSFGYNIDRYQPLMIKILRKYQQKILKSIAKLPDIFELNEQDFLIPKDNLIQMSVNNLINRIVAKLEDKLDLIKLVTSDNDYLHIDKFIQNRYLEQSEKTDRYHEYKNELLGQLADVTNFTETQLTQWIRVINRKKQAIFQGPPGTGKTFISQKLAQHLIAGGDGFWELIQFHPAYTYEDFIQGIRPQTQDGKLTYPVVPGRFLKFCQKAALCQDTCVLIIDEINRANLSQVFGELMYLLEYRDEKIPLAGSENLFSIPENVRIIGTMNTADRSIALVDNALRRRFAFITLSPNYEILRQYHNETKTDFSVDGLIKVLKEVNQKIKDSRYEVGVSFFLQTNIAEEMQDIWQMEIEPYLDEFFFAQPETVNNFRWEKICHQILPPT
ncbi:MAG: AAA family ATPase [Microcoleaceae cyanobacterium]